MRELFTRHWYYKFHTRTGDYRHAHQWSVWAAAFLYFGFLGSVRTCGICRAPDLAVLGGYPDERRNRGAAYLTARLAR